MILRLMIDRLYAIEKTAKKLTKCKRKGNKLSCGIELVENDLENTKFNFRI